MSTAVRKLGTQFVAAQNGTTHASSQRPSRPRGKYKPRLASTIRVAMEDAVSKAQSARSFMGLILDWIADERVTTKGDIQSLVDTAPITAIAHGMYQDRLIRLGELAEHIGRLAIEVTAVETELREALHKSKEAAP